MMHDALVYKTLLVVAYFSFLRLSNLLPHTVGSFDPSRQLARGHIYFTTEGATLLIELPPLFHRPFNRTHSHSLAVWWIFHLPLQSNLLTFHLITLTFVVPI